MILGGLVIFVIRETRVTVGGPESTASYRLGPDWHTNIVFFFLSLALSFNLQTIQFRWRRKQQLVF